MAYTAPLFSTESKLGVDLSTSGLNSPFTPATAATTTPEYPTPSGYFALGTQIEIANGGRAIYAGSTAAALTAGDVVYLTGGTAAAANQAVALSTTNAATAGQSKLAVALSSLTTGQTGWFLVEGICPAINVVTAAANALLHTSATAGRLTGVLTTGVSFAVTAIIVTTTSGATAGTPPGIIGQGFSINTANVTATLG